MNRNHDYSGDSYYPDCDDNYEPYISPEQAERNAEMAIWSFTHPDSTPEPPPWFNDIPDYANPPPAASRKPVEPPEQPQASWEHEMPTFGNFGIHLATETVATKVEWLWKGWLPLKSLAIMSAPPGVGKTTISISLASAVTRGGPFPDGSTCHQGGVGHWSTEDNRYTVLQPHYEAERADMPNVRYLGGRDPKSGLAPMCQSLKDQDYVIDCIRFDFNDRKRKGLAPLKLVIIDNILNIMGGKDGNSNTDVRAALVKFSNLAAELNICILGVAHTSKDHKDKGLIQGVMGAQSFVGIARVLINVGKRYGESTGIIVRGKASNASDYGGYEYTIEPMSLESGIETTSIRWGEYKDGTADELMKQYASVPDAEQTDAANWLLDRLKFGPVDSAQIATEAKEEGFSTYALRKARAQPNIACRQLGSKGTRGGCRSLIYRTDIAEPEDETPPEAPVPVVPQTVHNNSYLAAKEGYMN